MWTSLRVKNFKGYQDSQRQEFKRFTVLIGPNGGGKSTLIQLFLLLKQTVEASDPRSVLAPDGKWVELGSFRDFVYQNDLQKVIEIYLGWVPSISERLSYLSLSDPEFRWNLAAFESMFKHLAKNGSGRIAVSQMRYLDRQDQELMMLVRQDDDQYHLDIRDDWRGQRLQPRSVKYAPEQFYRFPSALLADLPSETEDRLRAAAAALQEQIERTFYIGPLRYRPKRFEQATGQQFSDLGVTGENTGQVLFAEANGELIQLTNHWLQELDIAEEIQVVSETGGGSFQVYVTGKGQKKRVNILDYGFGASQVLPVVVESLFAPDGATVLIEQPEIHLNAHHQLKLPDFFAKLVRSTHKQFIIETHSEYFLKRLSTLVARKELAAEDVSILYCYANENGCHVHAILLDEAGRYSWWPPDFLSEGFEGTAEYLEAVESQAEADEDDREAGDA